MWGARTVALGCAVVALAACGGPPAQEVTFAPIEGESTPTVEPQPEIRCPNYVADPQPDDHPGGGDYRTIEAEQDRIWDDVQRARDYGNAHPDNFAGHKFGNHPRVRLVIAFTANIDAHCFALRELLDYPDEFELHWQRYSQRQLEAMQTEDAAALADDFLRRYPGAFDFQVGLHPYPPERITGPAYACATALPEDAQHRDGIEATVRLTRAELAPGEDGEGTLIVRNTGARPITFVPYPVFGVLVRSGTREVLGAMDNTAMAGVGVADRTLAPGEEVSVGLRFGTAACDVSAGYVLQAGQYSVVAHVLVTRGGAEERVLSAEAPLHLR